MSDEPGGDVCADSVSDSAVCVIYGWIPDGDTCP